MSSMNENISSACIDQPGDDRFNTAVLESSSTSGLDPSVDEKVSVQEDVEPPMSKSKLKKMLKKERWQSLKAERNQYMKEKRKRKRQEQRESGVELGPSKKLLKKNTMKNSTCKVQVVIDCSFDELMVDADINKLGQQIQYCYSSNRRAPQPLQLYLTSVSGKTQERLDKIGDYRGWDMNIKSRSYLEEFTKESIVYLTSDSPNVLESLDQSKVYIIGGLVDHNHHKGLCFEMAQKHGVGHAQLPIGEYVQLSSRKVLTVNHVFEILLNFTETQSWKESFFRVIPRRKQVGESRHERRLKRKLNGEQEEQDDSSRENDEGRENDEDELDESNSEDERVELDTEIVRVETDCENEPDKEVSQNDRVEITASNNGVDENSENKRICTNE